MTTPPHDRAYGLAVHLVPAAGRTKALAAAIDSLHTPARRWRLQMAGLVNAGPHAAVLEYAQPAAEAADAAQRDLAHLTDLVDRSGSFALAGDRLIFTGGAAVGPIRYWYCMRRRDDFSHDDFLARYRDVHSQFGLETTGIEGYTQWHADLEASAAVGERLGLGACGYDSISVLEIADLNTFFTAAMSSDVGERAMADEELFVDRANSHDHVLQFISETGPRDNHWDLPDDFAERYGPWALITGGSEGTGAAFARRLAEQGINLVLVARRSGPLEALAAEVASDHGVAVRTASVDLTDLEAAARLAELTADLDVGTVLFNAGATTRFETFDEWPSADVAAMVVMNCYTVALAAHHFAPRMRRRGSGAVVLIGSMAGFAGSSHHSVYNASKAFDWVLAEGLWKELGGDGVDALVLVLGATDTPSHQRMGVDFEGQTVMDPDDVAVEGLANLQQGPVYIVGDHNRAIFDFILTSDRAALVSAMSEASGRIAPKRSRDSEGDRQ